MILTNRALDKLAILISTEEIETSKTCQLLMRFGCKPRPILNKRSCGQKFFFGNSQGFTQLLTLSKQKLHLVAFSEFFFLWLCRLTLNLPQCFNTVFP